MFNDFQPDIQLLFAETRIEILWMGLAVWLHLCLHAAAGLLKVRIIKSIATITKNINNTLDINVEPPALRSPMQRPVIA